MRVFCFRNVLGLFFLVHSSFSLSLFLIKIKTKDGRCCIQQTFKITTQTSYSSVKVNFQPEERCVGGRGGGVFRGGAVLDLQ